MDRLRFTLLSDGSSDRALLPVLSWALQATGGVTLAQGQWADLGVVRGRTTSLKDRIDWAVELFPCDLLFIHRDAERQEPGLRRAEVDAAWESVASTTRAIPRICVVPVRMQEAWLLFDERAIRIASGNPNGIQALGLPRIEDLESLPDPKSALHEALERASGLVGRRLKKFEPQRRCFDVADCAADSGFEPLARLPAFRRLLDDVAAFRSVMAPRSGELEGDVGDLGRDAEALGGPQ